ncbi:hypothetical protein HJG53_06025 [Sphingomonas sp. ID1715]|uniref:hypothetical protein n=1 Tax=Sphingomonas sp. ID1715 TaxID=1656898 RepID=UPI001487B4E1|nr:hypothetical protein [Sphingomonas sp. ID1715]NNM76458.1 hypothetical protein [Sphingomonas sp. ID1715]
MTLHVAASAELLSRCFEERDELLNWLEALEDRNADPQAISEVRQELDRVLCDLRKLGVPEF